MRTYDNARELTVMPAGTAGGRTRYIRWELDGQNANVIAYDTVVVTFTPDRVILATGGHVTPSTFDAIATALDVSRYGVGTRARVPYVLGNRMTENMMLDYAGQRLPDPLWAPYESDWLNHHLSPLAEPRSAMLGVDDVSVGTQSYRVHVYDWTYDGRDHTATARKLAAAYVGLPYARTSVVRRGSYPTHSEPFWTIEVEA